MTPGPVPFPAYLLAGIVVACGLGGSVALLATQTPRSLRTPLLVATVWYLGLLVAVMHVGYAALHVDDPVRYDVVSAVIADQARAGMVPGFRPFQITSFGYYSWVAAFYVLFGHNVLIPQLMNLLLALVAGVLTYRLTRRLGGSDRAAWLAAVAALLYPTLAVWSVMLLKDILAVVFSLLCVDLALTLRERPAPWAWPLLAACAFAVSTIRFYLGILGLAMGIGVGLWTCVQSIRPRYWAYPASLVSALVAVAGTALLAFTLAATFRIGEGPWYLTVLETRSSLVHEQIAFSGGGSSLASSVAESRSSEADSGARLASGGSRAAPGGPRAHGGSGAASGAASGESTAEDFSPVGGGPGLSQSAGFAWKVFRIFLVPLPSQPGGVLVQIGKLDGLFWWPLIALVLWGLFRGFSTSWEDTLLVALPLAALPFFYALVLTNAGSILRYRAALFPFGAILAGLGIDALVARAPSRVLELWKRVA